MRVPHAVSPRVGETACLVVGTDADLISSAFRARAAAAGLRVRLVEPPRLADTSVVFDGTTLLVDGEEVGGLLFRGRSHGDFSAGFRREDRVFVDVEIAAVWLAAMQLPTVRCVNRYDAHAWYDISPWAAWTSRLAAAGVPTAAVAIGDAEGGDGRAWLPYTECALRPLPEKPTRRILGSPVVEDDGVQHFLVVAGEPLSEAADAAAAVRSTGRALAHLDMQLAGVMTNGRGEVIAVDTAPLVSDPATAEIVGERLVRWLLS